jgi:hypothetical protein
MRKSLIGLVLALSLSSMPAFSANTPKAGSACTKKGVTKTYKGKEFKCIKKGGKLVWSKGKVVNKETSVAAPEVIPTPIPSPTTTSSLTPPLTPTPPPTPIPRDLTFSNITENIDAISINVFSQYERLMATNYTSSIKVNTLVGPNTVPVNKTSATAFQIGSKIFQNFKQPDEVFAIYYTFADKEWAKNQVAMRAGKDVAEFQFGYSCPNAMRCWDASASITLDWKAISHFGASDPGGAIHGSQLSGEIQIHEFTHSVSFYQLKPNRGDYYNLTPDWFAEGHASFTGKLGATTNFDQYSELRVEALRRNRPQADIQDYRPQNVLRFLESFMKYPEVSPIQRFYLYTLGWSTVEALAAIGGIDSPMNLYLETVNGFTFKQAFKKIYGIDWDTAAPILAEVVSKQYGVYYP